jgi:hypothetical protein
MLSVLASKHTDRTWRRVPQASYHTVLKHDIQVHLAALLSRKLAVEPANSALLIKSAFLQPRFKYVHYL